MTAKLREHLNTKRALARRILAAAVFAAVLCAIAPAVPSYAEGNGGKLLPADDLSGQTASITVRLIWTNDDEEVPLEGVGIKLYKVASLSVRDGKATYSSVSDFENAGISYEGMTAGRSEEAAETLAALAKSNGISPVKEGKSDADGECVFTSLEPGIYLGVQSGAKKMKDGRKVSFMPSLWLAPSYHESADGTRYEWDYDVTVCPKPGVCVTEPQKTENDPHKHTNVKTGDESNLMFYLGIMIASTSLVLYVIGRRRKRS
ncbi:MAG: LPXTG cell wall anchor domain-containing protein [Mogibacterium sp.]|nr:LPXTG cell wall anchor domain-containing protein [Mogibacterium sp.]